MRIIETVELFPELNRHMVELRYITELADRWAIAYAPVSPRILAEQVATYQTELYEHVKTLDPFGTAAHPVSWAGETVSYTWFDIAREYTEMKRYGKC